MNEYEAPAAGVHETTTTAQLDERAVTYSVTEDIATITLNRPHRLNAVTPLLVEQLCEALDRATADLVAAAVVTGAGRAFCSGHDLRQDDGVVPVEEQQRRLHRIQDVTRKVRQAPFPVIAAVRGYALGAGCEFALCCDLIVASRDAVFGFPEVGVGLGTTGGISHILPATLGLAKAKELVLLGEHFTAEQAAALNLVNLVVELADLDTAGLTLARTLAARPRRALVLAKQALDRGAQSGIDAAYDIEIANSLALRDTAEAQSAAATFQHRSDTHKGAR